MSVNRPRYMFWSPVVRPGLARELKKIGFDEAIEQLREKARVSTADANNPAFRVLQILEHLRHTSD